MVRFRAAAVIVPDPETLSGPVEGIIPIVFSVLMFPLFTTFGVNRIKLPPVTISESVELSSSTAIAFAVNGLVPLLSNAND